MKIKVLFIVLILTPNTYLTRKTIHYNNPVQIILLYQSWKFELDTGNPRCLYSLSTLLILCLIFSFGFPGWIATNESSLSRGRKISKFLESDWLFEFCNQHSDWLNFIHFPGNKLKKNLILRFVIKRGDQALISMFKTKKFSAQGKKDNHKIKWCIGDINP